VSPHKNTDLYSQVSDLITTILIAISGGAVHAVNNKPGRWSWRRFVTGIITAAFAGLVMNFILEGLGVSEKTRVAIVGMAGYAAHDLLEVLKQRLITLVKGAGQDE